MPFPGVHFHKLEPRHEDDRGWLIEMYRSDDLPIFGYFAPQMAYLSMTKPGVTRGPHEHVRQTDLFVFMGPGRFELSLWDNRKSSDFYGQVSRIYVGESDPAWVIIPPGVIHAYKNISEVDGFVYNLPDALYRGPKKELPVDEIRYEGLNHPLFGDF